MLNLLYLARKSVLLGCRIQAAIQRSLLDVSHPAVVLQLESYREAASRKQLSVREKIFNWSWLIPSFGPTHASSKTLSIHSCMELERSVNCVQF